MWVNEDIPTKLHHLQPGVRHSEALAFRVILVWHQACSGIVDIVWPLIQHYKLYALPLPAV